MTALTDRLTELAKLARDNGVDEIGLQAEQLVERLGFDRVHLVVVGEFNRGKSTLVNALIGRPLLPMDIVPTTAAIWTVQKGKATSAEMVMADGSKKSIETSIESLSRLNAEGTLAREGVRFVNLEVPELAVGDDVVLIDTPGVNDINEQRAEITYSFLGQADAAIFVLDASSPVTKSEAQFIEGQMLQKALERILFVLNKVDRIEPDEVQDGLGAAQERLTELIGHPVRVVSCDGGRILDALSKGQLEAADHWGWAKLRLELDELLEQSRSGQAREKTAELRTRALASRLEERIASRLQLAQMKGDELQVAKTAFDEDIGRAKQAFERFIAFCEVQGRDRLKIILSQSLRGRTDEFTQATQVSIASMRGDFKVFAEKQLPYQMQLLIKRWFDATQPTIDEFLATFSRHAADEYHKHFGSVFGYAPGAARVSTPVDASSGPTLTAEDPSEIAGLALPAAGYIATSFLGIGPFVIVGLAAGQLVNKLLRDHHTEETRARLSSELPMFLEQSVAKPFDALLSSVDDWFELLTAALRQQFETDLSRRRNDFDDAGKNHTESSADDLRNAQKKATILAGS